MSRAYDVITFDCYGTLVDWDSGISGWFRRVAAEAGREISREEVLALYAEVEPRVEAGPYRSYRRVLTETASEIGKRLGLALAEERAATLADSLPGWPAFADTVPALERLSGAGHALAILSNVDEDLLATTLARLRVPIAWTVTAENVRSYKPAPGHFLAARTRIGGARWLHAAQSFFHDIAPASSLGIPTAWVNRKGERPPAGGPPPGLVVPTLAGLADVLAAG